ncbi:hypothetical protein, partial [Novosphingobium sp. AAP93]|uniref:hypothetical protein n=1 Tax=Novosphingobium sp. AAP93 TaxID=1523427 RepID=UPI000A947B12
VNAAARSVIDGTDFGDNIIAALPDVIANTIGNLAAEKLASIGRGGGDPTNLLAGTPFDGDGQLALSGGGGAGGSYLADGSAGYAGAPLLPGNGLMSQDFAPGLGVGRLDSLQDEGTVVQSVAEAKAPEEIKVTAPRKGTREWNEIIGRSSATDQYKIDVLVNARNQALGNRAWFQSPNKTTYCNFATTSIVRAYDKAGLIDADAFNAFMRTSLGAHTANVISRNLRGSDSWRPVGADEAQAIADGGGLVILTYENPRGHGHVATIRPQNVTGDLIVGGRKTYPILANVGIGASRIVYRSMSVSMRKPVVYYTPR